MRGWALLMLLAVPGASACQLEVTPMLEIHIDTPEGCSVVRRGGCDPVPAQPIVYDGYVRWEWDVDECTSQSGLMQDEVHLSLAAVGPHKEWLIATFTPAEFTIPLQEYYDPTDLRVEGQRIFAQNDVPFEVSFEAVREPVGDEIAAIEQRDGMVITFVKAAAEGEGARPAFTIRSVVFEAGQIETADEEPDRPTPVPLLVPLALLVAAYPRMRR